jgi:hypothetical protein
MYVWGCTRFHRCAGFRFSPPRPRLPPRLAPPSSVTGNPVAQGRGFRLGGTGKLTTTRGESYLNSLNVTRFGSRSAPRFVHLSVFPNPPPSLKCEVELWRPVEAHLLLACRSWAPHLTKRPVDAHWLLACRIWVSPLTVRPVEAYDRATDRTIYRASGRPNPEAGARSE